MRTLLTVIGVLAFVGFLALVTMQGQRVECEVCMQVGGQVHCAKTAAEDAETAMAGAISSVCGTYAGPMDAELQCRNRAPYSTSCTR